MRLPKTRAALAYAQRLHEGQRREADGAPFIEHPIEVATLLHTAGAPDYLIAAGVLHDIVEKTDVNAAEVRARFGSRVARLVLAVSEDERIPDYDDRKGALRTQVAAAGPEALTLFAADKISKPRELSLEHAATGQPLCARRRRLDHYRHCLRLLDRQPVDPRLVTQLRTEIVKAGGYE